MTARFEGRRAVVTGAGSGMGRATLRRLASEGATVLGLDVSHEGLKESCNQLERATYLAVDIRDASALDALRAYDPDILVNAAGILRRYEVLAHPLDDWHATLDVNLKAMFRLSREFAAARVPDRRGGVIVNICSVEAYTAAPAHLAYTVSKSGAVMLTKAFALELAEYGIRVVGIAPGVTMTGMNVALRDDPVRSKQLQDPIPMKRFGHPEEQAAVIAFLASDDASYITGAVVPVDGGWLTH
jgi:2-deoxy-D-gluconate 3-dehydrogenase